MSAASLVRHSSVTNTIVLLAYKKEKKILLAAQHHPRQKYLGDYKEPTDYKKRTIIIQLN